MKYIYPRRMKSVAHPIYPIENSRQLVLFLTTNFARSISAVQLRIIRQVVAGRNCYLRGHPSVKYAADDASINLAQWLMYTGEELTERGNFPERAID